MEKPYISIITPCFNGAKFIESAIQSVISQPENRIEMIIVDDGSTDKTDEVCKKYEGERVRYYRTENLGTGHARNYALQKASGVWISYLDSDDLYLTGALNSSLFEKLIEYEKKGIDIIYTPWCLTDMELKQYISVVEAENPDRINVIPELAFWTCFYRREYLKDNSIKFYEYKRQDIESAFRYLAFSQTKNIVTNNQIKFYLQRNNLDSNTHIWRNQTVHEVKALVYYDLFKNYSNSFSRRKLLKILFEEMEQYYICCKVEGCDDVRALKNVNELFVLCAVQKLFFSIRTIGIKQMFKLVIRYGCVNLNRKRVNEKCVSLKFHRNRDSVNTMTVMKRLKVVSDFILFEELGE